MKMHGKFQGALMIYGLILWILLGTGSLIKQLHPAKGPAFPFAKRGAFQVPQGDPPALLAGNTYHVGIPVPPQYVAWTDATACVTGGNAELDNSNASTQAYPTRAYLAIWNTSTTAAFNQLVEFRHISSQGTGGTTAAMNLNKSDANDPAAVSTAKTYSAVATGGQGFAGMIGLARASIPETSATSSSGITVAFAFGGQDGYTTIRNTEGLLFYLDGSASCSYSLAIEWFESSTNNFILSKLRQPQAPSVGVSTAAVGSGGVGVGGGRGGGGCFCSRGVCVCE